MTTATDLNADRPREQGMAIIIVLAFVVLLSGLVVAFFSRALVEQQVSSAGANQVKADVLAESAADIVLASLKREILLGSDQESGIYFPSTSLDSQPRRTDYSTLFDANTGTSAIPNLVRRSKYLSHTSGLDALPFADHASNAPTWSGTDSKLRQITPDRWNAHFLMPLSPTTNNEARDLKISTPTARFFNVVPDWIYLNAGASLGPIVVGLDSPSNVSQPVNIIGRYAYMIYDVGGLLDANVAGYPIAVSGSSTFEQYSKKQSPGYADLTVIPAAVTGSLTGPYQINRLVAWRNGVTAGSTDMGGSFSRTNDYHSYLTDSTLNSHFLKVQPTTQTGTAAKSDQAFVNRQTLIKAWSKQINTVLTSATSVGGQMMPLQYFTTFSRDLNQPSLAPHLGRPLVVSGTANNTADRIINPKFLTVTVGSSFARNNGTTAVPGEPLVKSRFPLNKLALLGGNNSNDILKYFGLESAGQSWEWKYRPDEAGNPADRILTLREVAAENREPDFFELLKAAITVGSLGQVSYTSTGTPYETAQYLRDVQTDDHIIQIGANIIDQYDADSYPTRIAITSNSVVRNLYGIENLPYLYRLRNGVIKVENSSVTGVSEAPPAPTLSSTVIANGMAMMFVQPEVWNPHQTNPAVTPGSYPTMIRFVMDSGGAAIRVTSETVENPGPLTGIVSSTAALTGSCNPPFQNNFVPTPLTPTFGNTGMRLTPATARFREPVPLIQPNIPTTTGLVLENPATNLMASIPAPQLKGTGTNRYVTSIQTAPSAPTSTGVNFIGVYLGLAPLSWVVENADNDKYVVSAEKLVANSTSATEVECRLQFTPDGTNWYDYDQKFVPLSIFGSQTIKWTAPGDNHGVIGTDTWGSVIDPRTGRFGMPAGLSTTPARAAFSNGATTAYTMATNRPDDTAGLSIGGPEVQGLPTSTKWHAPTFSFGLLSENRHGGGTYYADSDNVVRRGAGAFASGAVGLPEATASAARPIILNRPFNSVAELGYVFSGIPWRNLDMFTPESGFTGLLDVFTIDESVNTSSMVAGRVNMNTRQVPVLSSLIRSSYQDVNATTVASLISAANANLMAARGVSFTGTASGGALTFGTNYVKNISEVVGKWRESNGNANGTMLDGSTLYTGLSNDLSQVIAPVTDNARAIERFREAPVRTLSNMGSTRVWNLMIDVIAQSGKHPSQFSPPSEFKVMGESRLWIHVAIDRYTGKIIDKQVEVVQE